MVEEEVQDLIVIGKIIKPHGIKGEVKAVPLGISAERFHEITEVWIHKEGLKTRPLKLVSSRLQPGGLIIKLDEIHNRDEAEELRDWGISAPRNKIPSAPEDGFEEVDLVGLAVVDGDRTHWGIIKEVLQTPGQNLLVIDNQGNEVLVPAVGAFIKEVNKKKGIVTIESIEGLLEVNDN